MSDNDNTADWSRLWNSPEMLRLRRDRRDFFGRAWALFGVSFSALLAVVAFDPDLTAHRLFPGMSVGLLLSLTYVAVVMSLAALYVRRSRRWDVLAATAVAHLDAPTAKEKADV